MSSKLRKPNVSAQIKKENPYEPFKFTRNPFPKRPGVTIGSDDSRENGSIYCPELVEEEEKQFAERKAKLKEEEDALRAELADR